MAHWSWGSSFPGDSEGASSASSDSEEESSSLASASSAEKLPEAVCLAAVDGDIYPAYLHEHRKQVLMLRCLATKGRATTTDPVMNFLEQLGDNGVIWTVLSFWPPPP